MSLTPSKSIQKMCKSPKNPSFQMKQDKIEYENINTNCTVVGSNNLNLVKKPQLVTNMSPVYSNPSPNYPQSPYSSPASLKSPSPSSMKPPTPQPNFPVMQIFHNNFIPRSVQPTPQPPNIIKLKPHLNILPKPSASPQPSPKPSVSPQIVIPAANQPAAAAAAATLMPAAQPLLLNQMQMLAAPTVQLILRSQTATPMAAATTKIQTGAQGTQSLILQPAATQQLLQLGTAPARSQPLVRVLTNGVQLNPTTTYVTTQVANQPINATQIQQTVVNSSQIQQQQQQLQQISSIKKKPKAKVKKKLDLANLMKLSGIGDDDDMQFESDASQSESEHNSISTTPQSAPYQQQHHQLQADIPAQSGGFVQNDAKKNIQNIQISAVGQPTINTATPVVQVLNQNFQSGMISNSTTQAQSGIPFNSFITPNFTINNGLMLQRSGGFKLTLGEDGRLVLQHDPTLNQDIQSQLILQSILGINGGLVLHPSMDQQTVQQTVQTIQQQSVQTIQQQTVQSQTIQTVQQQTVQPQVQHHTIQSLQPQIQQQTLQQITQHQTVNALQQPMQIVQPSLHSQVTPTVHTLQSQIQSLLQQQNMAVQAQAAAVHHHHHNVPSQNIHSQSIQNVQNVQNLSAAAAAQSAVQNVVTQNMQNLTQSSVQNLVAQNVQNASQCATTVQQNIMAAQNIAAHSTVQNIVTQNMHQGNRTVQSVQSAQSQTLQSPAANNGQSFQQAHTQTTQPVLKVQPFQKSQLPVQTVQPIQHQSPSQHHQSQQQQHASDNQNNSPNPAPPPPPPGSYLTYLNLTQEQLEQLKRNGQVCVNGQMLYMQRPNKDNNEKKLSPNSKAVKKIQKLHSIKSTIHDGQYDINDRKASHSINEQIKTSPLNQKGSICCLESSLLPLGNKHSLPQSHVQPIQNKTTQPQAMVQPSIHHHPIKQDRQKSPTASPKQQKVSPNVHSLQDSNGANTSQEVDKLLGQILDETNSSNNHSVEKPTQQRITTIQLTPQKQQHLKKIQAEIKLLTAKLPTDDPEVCMKLQCLFDEQHEILLSGKLLPPDKVYYHNNQITIVNPSSLNLPSPNSIKSESPGPVISNNHSSSIRTTTIESASVTSRQPITTTQSYTSPRVTVSVSTSTGDLPPPPQQPSIAKHAATIHHHPIHHQITQSNHQHHHHHPHHQQHPVHNSTRNASVNHKHVLNNNVTQLPTICTKQQQQTQLQSSQIPQMPPTQHDSTKICPQLASPPPPSPLQHHNLTNQNPPGQQYLAGPTTSLNSSQIVKSKPPLKNQQQPQQHTFNQSSQIQVYQQQQTHQQQQQQHFSYQQQPHQSSGNSSRSQPHNNQQHNFNDPLKNQSSQIQIQKSHLSNPVNSVTKQQTSNQSQQELRQCQLPLMKKAQLIERQLAIDQNGVTKPDTHTPFHDKRDACTRLLRYHCMDHPVLSEKDLDKADEIFELTARHFIGKYGKMIDKYKYLLMKEGMRQVQTSELMMLDRMLLADEQQHLFKLKKDYESGNLTMTAADATPQQQEKENSQISSEGCIIMGDEEYDEWACIQRELGCLTNKHDAIHHQQQQHYHHQSASSLHNHQQQPQQSNLGNSHNVSSSSSNHNCALKRTATGSDSRLETLKRFRVDKHTKKQDLNVNNVQCSNNIVNNTTNVINSSQTKCGIESTQINNAYCSLSNNKEEENENNSIDEQVQSAINSILNLQQSTAHLQSSQLDLDSILS